MFSKNKNGLGIKIYSTIQEFEANIPSTVKILTTPQLEKIYLVGTSHFSKKSHIDVSFVIRNVKPDGLVLELCPSRLYILHLNEQRLLKEIQNLNILKVMQIFKEHGITKGLFYLNFLTINAKIAKQLGIAPGGECRTAIKEVAKFPDCKIFLGDRPLKVTIDRALSGLSYKQKLKFLMEFLSNRVQKFRITEEYFEMLKEKDSKLLEQMKIFMPPIYNSFVTERDYILAHSMIIAVNKCRTSKNYPVIIVGITGIGHIKGIVENFRKTDAKIIKQLMKIPANKNHERKLTNPARYIISAEKTKGIIGATLKYLFRLRKCWKKFK